MIDIEIDDKALKRRIAVVTSRFEKWLDLDLTLSAKRTAFYLMEYTLPISTRGKELPIEPLKSRIETDINKAFPSMSDRDWEYPAQRLINDFVSEKRANEFMYNYKSRGWENPKESFNPDTGEYSASITATPEEDFKRIRGVPKRIDDKGYANLKRTKSINLKTGRKLPKETRPLAMVDSSRRGNYIKKRQKNAGLAKTGWWAAAKSLGGQMNYTASKSEAGRFVWPSALGQIARRISGLGSSTKSLSNNGGNVTITSRVSYADEVLPLKDTAMANAQNAMRIIFEKRFKNRKNYEVTASRAA